MVIKRLLIAYPHGCRKCFATREYALSSKLNTGIYALCISTRKDNASIVVAKNRISNTGTSALRQNAEKNNASIVITSSNKAKTIGFT